jgi:drug/metabolite transporter superfamily protein YnfA
MQPSRVDALRRASRGVLAAMWAMPLVWFLFAAFAEIAGCFAAASRCGVIGGAICLAGAAVIEAAPRG